MKLVWRVLESLSWAIVHTYEFPADCGAAIAATTRAQGGQQRGRELLAGDNRSPQEAL